MAWCVHGIQPGREFRFEEGKMDGYTDGIPDHQRLRITGQSRSQGIQIDDIEVQVPQVPYQAAQSWPSRQLSETPCAYSANVYPKEKLLESLFWKTTNYFALIHRLPHPNGKDPFGSLGHECCHVGLTLANHNWCSCRPKWLQSSVSTFSILALRFTRVRKACR